MSSCVACRAQQGTVVHIESRGVPHGSPGHQINYGWSSLTACPECGSGLLVRFDHDCFQQPWEEPWDMDWSWPVATEGIQRLTAAVARCPDPLQPSCGCPVHRSLRDSTEESLPRGVSVTVDLTEDGLPQVRSVGVR
ncbi:hypothetical protein MRQ36_27765 [Micromonospora sp. R77]|uniref:hypothetical protein n=1 Tax=Micromonospora sp. R77 TaxID=2925836 RepID=UPI001F603375|nr:hypothetical protein [Micromonospora sp. R77]MCI4066140.1 hypothetical protein [Micromonospora sp. R77]